MAKLARSASGNGYISTLADEDRVLRRTPLVMSWRNQFYPHLAMATLCTALGSKIQTPMIKISSAGIESIRLSRTHRRRGKMKDHLGPNDHPQPDSTQPQPIVPNGVRNPFLQTAVPAQKLADSPYGAGHAPDSGCKKGP